MHDLKGKTAVITGAGSGIGAALTRRGAAEGMNLVLADISEAETNALVDEIGHDRALAVRCDVSDQSSVENLANDAYERFGAVDLLCNNAGIVPGGRHRMVWEYTPGDWQWSLGVNLWGVIHGIRSFVPRMISAGRPGHILNTASVAGVVSGSGSACYGASKHAVVRVTEALYAGLREVGAPIGVTLFCPGLVRTAIYDAEQHRPDAFVDGERPRKSAGIEAMRDEIYRNALGPDEAAEIAFSGIMQDQFYVFTTTGFDDAIRQRASDILSRNNPTFESIVEMSQKYSERSAVQ